MQKCSWINQTLTYLLTGVSLAISLPVHATENQRQDLYLGSVAMDIPAAMVKRLTPLAKYLSAQTGYNISFRASANLESAVDDLGKGHTQIAYLTPVAYLEAHEKYKALPLVSPLTRGKSTFTLVIAVKKDSPVKTMQDLRGKKFAFGDKNALLQPAVVVEAGINLEDFSSYDYLNHYDNIAKAILNDDFDAGILKDTVAEKFEPKGLRIIHTSPPLPSYLFAVRSNLSPKTFAKLKKAMLALDTDTVESKAVLNALDQGYTGFAPVEDQDYDVIRKLIAPFRDKK